MAVSSRSRLESQGQDREGSTVPLMIKTGWGHAGGNDVAWRARKHTGRQTTEDGGQCWPWVTHRHEDMSEPIPRAKELGGSVTASICCASLKEGCSDPLRPTSGPDQGPKAMKAIRVQASHCHAEPSAQSPYLGLFLLSGIDDGGTTDFSNLSALTVKGPAADFVPDDILYEQDPSVKAQRELIKQFNVFQHVVVRVAAREHLIR